MSVEEVVGIGEVNLGGVLITSRVLKQSQSTGHDRGHGHVEGTSKQSSSEPYWMTASGQTHPGIWTWCGIGASGSCRRKRFADGTHDQSAAGDGVDVERGHGGVVDGPGKHVCFRCVCVSEEGRSKRTLYMLLYMREIGLSWI